MTEGGETPYSKKYPAPWGVYAGICKSGGHAQAIQAFIAKISVIGYWRIYLDFDAHLNRAWRIVFCMKKSKLFLAQGPVLRIAVSHRFMSKRIEKNINNNNDYPG